jgi:hypothetical protein
MLSFSDRIDAENRTQRRKARKEIHKNVFLVCVVLLKKWLIYLIFLKDDFTGDCLA